MNDIYSFYQLISKYQIEIPIIQRDYAQGRNNPKAEDVRKSMVTDMIAAVKGEKKLFFDFVYGRIVENKFTPFDGQQRLTTLYLFHKYIFEKCQSSSTCDYSSNCICKDILLRFSYATRQSSREFCEQLVENSIIPSAEYVKSISDEFSRHLPDKQEADRKKKTDEYIKTIIDWLSSYIKNQWWFYSDWEKDPTIMGMLVMLDEIHNSFQQQFKAITDFKPLAERLTSGCSCPITFHFVDMGEHKLSDETYVKMNARGKSLTPFENFKASLEQYLVDKNDDVLLSRLKENVDGRWLDLFWGIVNKNNENSAKILPDSAMMSFINRHFMNVWRCRYGQKSESEKQKYDTFNRRIIAEMPLYPTKDDFVSWENYEFVLKECGIKDCLAPIFNIWDILSVPGYANIIEGCQAVWNRGEGKAKWRLFEGDVNNNRETYPSRVAFYALLKFFGVEEKDPQMALEQWMRVVWNVIENSTIDSPDRYQAALRLIDVLSKECKNIYDALANRFDGFGLIGQYHAQEQIAEEITKANQIVKGGNAWKNKIEEAEQYAFFKGAIRFLFTKEDIGDDWDDFNTKWGNAQKYFDINGVKEEYKNNAILLRYYISEFKKWGEFWNFEYDNKPSTWKQLLISNRYKANHKILINLLGIDPDFSSFTPSLVEYDERNKELQEKVQKELVCSFLLSKISNLSVRLNWRYDNYCLYPYNTKSSRNIFVIANFRNTILSELITRQKEIDGENKKIETSQRIEGCDFFWGWDIDFRYYKDDKCIDFQWNTNGKIYLKENGCWKKKENPTEYYCCDVKDVSNGDDLCNRLDNLVEQASSGK